MDITDLYSERQKKMCGNVPDVYRYDDIPQKLRAQVVQLLYGITGLLNSLLSHRIVGTLYDDVAAILCYKYGHLDLDSFLTETHSQYHRLLVYLAKSAKTEEVLDIIELCFAKMSSAPSRYRADFDGIDRIASAESERATIDRNVESAERMVAKSAVVLNGQFLDHGVGYQLESGKIIRIESRVTHHEIVRPCLAILSGEEYANAKKEFLSGHEYYRKGDLKGALREWQNSFESVMKIICVKRGWEYPDDASAKDLIRVCLDHELIPAFWQSHFISLRQLLLGVGVARNKLSGHGEGPDRMERPRHVVAFALHMTAAAIVFLAEAEASGAGK